MGTQVLSHFRKYWVPEAMVLGYWVTEECILLQGEVIQYPNTMAEGTQYFLAQHEGAQSRGPSLIDDRQQPGLLQGKKFSFRQKLTGTMSHFTMMLQWLLRYDSQASHHPMATPTRIRRPLTIMATRTQAIILNPCQVLFVSPFSRIVLPWNR
jgi:hypothetical protein